MRAVILADGKLVVQDVPKPSPGHEEALVKMRKESNPKEQPDKV